MFVCAYEFLLRTGVLPFVQQSKSRFDNRLMKHLRVFAEDVG